MISSFFLTIVSHYCPSLSCHLSPPFHYVSSSSHWGLLEQVACGRLLLCSACWPAGGCLPVCVCTCESLHTRASVVHMCMPVCAQVCGSLSLHMLIFLQKCSGSTSFTLLSLSVFHSHPLEVCALRARMAASSALRTNGPCRLLTFTVLLIASLLNGKYLKNAQCKRGSTFRDRMASRGREGQKGWGRGGGVFVWMVFE